MNEQLAKSILNVAKNPMSATAIAQSVGKSKGYMIQDELQSLVDSGDLIADDSGKFTTYKAANKVTVANSRNAAKTSAASTENTLVVDKAIPARENVPEGYSVSKHIVRKSDKAKGHIITLPNSSKVFVEDGYSLLVINNEPIKCVKSTTTAFSLIAKYATDHGMTPYTVENTMTGTVGKVEDIQSYSGIIDIRIRKNNKAA